MTTRRFLLVIGLLAASGLLLASAGCASYHGAVGVHYDAHSGAHSRHASYEYGSSFYVGRTAFQVLYRPYGYGAGYWFRTRGLGPGRYCSRYCHSRRGHAYHHASCRHLGRYANSYRTSVERLIRAYGPY